MSKKIDGNDNDNHDGDDLFLLVKARGGANNHSKSMEIE